ncbi:MAG: hypothetical protein ACYTG5_06245 [Planctomycetota bacterium]|jgi:hypothetical protein
MESAAERPEHERALSCLQGFKSRSLPALQRRLACWKGLQSRRHADVLEDLLQELALDCLENSALILKLEERERHSRWFRLLQKKHYQLRLRSARRCEVREELDRLPASSEGGPNWEEQLEALDLHPDLLDGITILRERGVHLKNGRLNLERSSSQTGLSRDSIRRLWRELSSALGYDREYRNFWQRRLAEALLALAADQLLEAGSLHIDGSRERRPPASARSLRRVLGIRDSLASLPQEKGMRNLLAGLGGARKPDPIDPRPLLDLAARLRPEDAKIASWRFEAAIAYGDTEGAVAALRRARELGSSGVPMVLARARLAESRGRFQVAIGILRRARERRAGDARIRASLTALEAAAQGWRAAVICSRISRSQVW